MNSNRPKIRYIIQMAKFKDKDRILKAAREKQIVIYRGASIKLSRDFSTENLQARRDWHEISKVMNRQEL